MKTTLTEQDENSVRLDIEVAADEVQKAFDATLAQIAKDLKLPGFRKGHVPRHLVVQRFGVDTVNHQMLDDYLGDWYAQAVAETGIEPVERPKVDFDDQPEAGKDFSFNATVKVMPKPELGPYKGIEVPRQEVLVGDEEVDLQVDRLRREFGQLTAVGGRAPREGDYATVDFEAILEGEPVEGTSAEDYQVLVGSGQLLPELDQALLELTPGESTQVQVAVPEDYPAEELAGKTLDFALTLKEVKQLVLPDLNDDLAKDVSEFETLLELRLDIRKKLQASRDATTDRRFREDAVRKVVQEATLEVPAPVIEDRAHDLLEDFARTMAMQGLRFEDYVSGSGQTVEAMLAGLRPRAEESVKTDAVLEAIANAEGIEITDEDVEARLAEMAAQAGIDPTELGARVQDSGRMTAIKRQLGRERAVDLILEHAVAVAPPEESPSKPSSGDAGDEGGPVGGSASEGDDSEGGAGAEPASEEGGAAPVGE